MRSPCAGRQACEFRGSHAKSLRAFGQLRASEHPLRIRAYQGFGAPPGADPNSVDGVGIHPLTYVQSLESWEGKSLSRIVVVAVMCRVMFVRRRLAAPQNLKPAETLRPSQLLARAARPFRFSSRSGCLCSDTTVSNHSTLDSESRRIPQL